MTTEPTILTCGLCRELVYSATRETFDRDAMRKAVDEHDRKCANRTGHETVRSKEGAA